MGIAPNKLEENSGEFKGFMANSIALPGLGLNSPKGFHGLKKGLIPPYFKQSEIRLPCDGTRFMRREYPTGGR
jgi:hypothetical protein